jgi:tRNA nucleotidyltransferase (CCA-adding enzyme)
MLLAIPFEALYLCHRLYRSGFEAYLVGGAVRDLILKSLNHPSQVPTATITDYDCTTDATPEQIQTIFPINFYENTFGTVSVTHPELLKLLEADGLTLPLSALIKPQTTTTANKIIDLAAATKLHESLQPPAEISHEAGSEIVHPFEITTYRSEGVYDDHRRPSSVSWGHTIEEDLERRDFTINAIALRIDPLFLTDLFRSGGAIPAEVILKSDQYTLIDPHHGIHDLSKQTIRTVGNPVERFHEDALRMLRAIRLACQLGCAIETTTFAAIQTASHLLKHVSGERIRDEFLKMLGTSRPTQAITLLDETGLLAVFLPELSQAKGVRQGGHHTTDVWTHSLDALGACPSPDPIVRLATLLHDVGKPATYRLIDGAITFYNHEIVGAKMVRQIAYRLKLSNSQIQRLYTLVRHHMFHYQPHNTDASIRRFMRKVGLEYIDDILDVREGDRLGSGARKTSWRLEEMKQRMIEQLNQPMDVKDLAINGHDLMTEFQLKPGPILGKILHNLFERVLDNPDLNTKAKLLEISQEIIATETA